MYKILTFSLFHFFPLKSEGANAHILDTTVPLSFDTQWQVVKMTIYCYFSTKP